MKNDCQPDFHLIEYFSKDECAERGNGSVYRSDKGGKTAGSFSGQVISVICFSSGKKVISERLKNMS